MGNLADHVDIVITSDSVSIARQGFGVPLILGGPKAGWVERVREYARYSDVLEDWDADTPEAMSAAAMFSQNPRPSRILIGRSALPATLQYTLEATAADSHAYSLNVKGPGMTEDTVDYTSDSGATKAEIHKGLLDALNAFPDKNFTAAYEALVVADDTFTAADTDICTAVAHGLVTGDGPIQVSNSGGALPAGLTAVTDYWVIRLTDDTFSLATTLALALAGTAVNITDAGTGTHTLSDTVSTVRPSEPITVTGDTAGDWFSLESLEVAMVSIYMSHVDPGVGTDLANIKLENDSWYWLHTLYNSEPYVTAAATWVATETKFYWAGTSDTRDLGTSTGTAGVLDYLADAGRTRVAGLYHPDPSAMAAAAIIGNLAPREVGSWTAKFKTLEGIVATSMSATQRANLVARFANFYETVSGVDILSEGTTSAGPSSIRGFVDAVVGLDWVSDDAGARIFGALAGAAKIPRTDAGMVVLQNELLATMGSAVDREIAAPDPEPTVEVPLVSEMDDLLPRGVRMYFSFTMAGAIHEVSPVSGVVVL